jgi:hypothetical protein
MSSDDSDVDDQHRKVFRVTILVWRRSEIVDYMQFIDKQRSHEDGGYAEQGAEPSPRVRDLLSAQSNRKPPRELPRCLYDDTWFEKNHRKFSVNVSREEFQWLRVTTSL